MGSEVKTLVELLARQGADADRVAYTFLAYGGSPETHISYRELDRRARRLGGLLAGMARPGDRVALIYPPGLDFIVGFFGCLYAGLVAVPAYPPHPRRPERAWPQLQAIIQTCLPAVVLSTTAIRAAIEPLWAADSDLPRVGWLTEEVLAGSESGEVSGRPALPKAGGDALALLQYTSGSTGTPKGVMLTHANLLHNLTLIQDAFDTTRSSRAVFWLPFYHDMGLIGGILETLYCGGHCTFLSPAAFVQQPLRWLEAISLSQATISGGPNFAYEECVRHIPAEARERLDLSSWEVAFCGAEPIHHETLERFAEAFAPCGFRREAFLPCYGLAEATLFVSGGQKGAPLVLTPRNSDHSDTLDSPPGNTVFPHTGSSTTRMHVGCGGSPAGQEIRIVDPDTNALCPEGTVGEIRVSGPSVAQGYWNSAQETAAVFERDPSGTDGVLLRTGDLGFLRGGNLFVTGRLKEMMIIGGRNHYPQDLERSVQACDPAIADCAAFSIEVENEERLVMVVEAQRSVHRERRNGDGGPSPADSASHGRVPETRLTALARAVRRTISEQHELAVHAVVFVPPLGIPKTSSGKTRRRALRAGYLAGTLNELPQRTNPSPNLASAPPGAMASPDGCQG